MDRYSPLAPAFVRVLVLPVGQIERERFLNAVQRLTQIASIVKLEDVLPYVGEGELLLPPSAFPEGRLLYNYTTSVPSEYDHQLSPYELFREPLLVLGVVDGLGEGAASGLEELGDALRYLREKHQRVVHRQLLVVDNGEAEALSQPGENAVRVSEAAFTDAAALRYAIFEVSARFLAELSTYTRALQASPSIQTPGQTARSLQRSASTRDRDKPPPSGRSTPTQASDTGSPVDSSDARTPPYGRSSPATSFDQIASNAQNALSRSESRASNRARNAGRASSQDRVSVQGFGSMSQEKLKSRGKARVGIVTGYVYMMAGQWGEALKILTENTHKARTLSDFLWHAKGMEGILICLLLHAWAGIDFQIPTICYPITDRVTSGHSQRFSINLPSDFRTPEAAQKASLHRLSNYLPDLIKQILNLYDSGEASLELPFLVISEATIRCSKLLLVLQRDPEMSPEALKQLLHTPSSDDGTKRAGSTNGAQRMANSTIANMLADAQPMAEDNVPTADQVAALAGIASVYTSLGMKRKRAAIMREMVLRLTSALTQARKRGAAEMGIHPAATLSIDSGAEAMLAATELGGGLHQMLEDVAVSYGVPSLSNSRDAVTALLAETSGNEALKQSVLTELSALCEASPDLQGLLRVNTALLKTSNPPGDAGTSNLSQEEQIRLTSTINRSVGVSRHLGLSKLEATYWDSFLVRDVVFTPPDSEHAIVNRTANRSSQQTAANPLLYDPNASRPGTAASAIPAPALLVQGEIGECIVRLQNPYDVPLEVESLALVTEGVELATSHQPITLGPLRVQEVPLSVLATETGDCKITACRVQIASCAEQAFPIFRKAWAAPANRLIKAIGQEAGVLVIDKPAPPASETVLVNVIEAQPLLSLQNAADLEDGFMLLDGESVDVHVVLKNETDIEATITDFATNDHALSLLDDISNLTINAGETKPLHLRLNGKPGLSHASATLTYSHPSSRTPLRLLSLSTPLTVNASLTLQNADILPSPRLLALDIANAWPCTLTYTLASATGSLAPGQTSRVLLPISPLNVPHDASTHALRAALFSHLHGHWNSTDDDARSGRIDVHSLRLPDEALERLRPEPVDLRLDILNSPTENNTGSGRAKGTAVVKAGSFLTLRATLTPSTRTSTPLILNFSPGAADNSERAFAAAGTGWRIVPPLDGREGRVEFAVCPLLAGRVELEVAVRPARMLRRDTMSSEGWVVRRSVGVRVV